MNKLLKYIIINEFVVVVVVVISFNVNIILLLIDN